MCPDVIGVVVVEAGGAVVFAFAGAVFHAFDAQVAEAFDSEHFCDFVGSHGACCKFALAREVHPEEAGMGHGWRCDADVHFEGTCVTQHSGENAERGSANDGVFDNANAFVLKHAFDGVELEADFLFADVLGRVDEGAAHVMVAE